MPATLPSLLISNIRLKPLPAISLKMGLRVGKCTIDMLYAPLIAMQC